MPVNGKNKGNSFERKMANLLSARFESLTGLPQSFRRNPDSGSFFGGGNKKRTETHDLDHAFFGDLICPKNFKFSIECKNYKSGPSFSSIVKGTIPQWDKWIEQATQDAQSAGLDLMLIIKYNNVEEILITTKNYDEIGMIMKYDELYCYRLAEILALPDPTFFNI